MQNHGSSTMSSLVFHLTLLSLKWGARWSGDCVMHCEVRGSRFKLRTFGRDFCSGITGTCTWITGQVPETSTAIDILSVSSSLICDLNYALTVSCSLPLTVKAFHRF